MTVATPAFRRVLLPEAAVADPLDAIDLAPGEPAFYWRSDCRDIEIAALGAVATVDARGRSRFADAAAALRQLVADTEHCDASLPLAVGGFAFGDDDPTALWAGFPALRFFVPRVLWIRLGGVRRMVITSPVSQQQTPACLLASQFHRSGTEISSEGEDSASWRLRVDQAVDSIRSGRIEKVVLARRRSVETATAVPASALLRNLAESRPECFTFLLRWSGRTFLGSSPERLLRLDQGEIQADALAGTAARGLSKPHDETLARELFASPKERREHRIVADAIRDALAPVATDIRVADEPVVLSLPEAHHLHTPVTAKHGSGAPAGLLEIAARLHPTPAVCGAPRDKAFAQLAAEEPDRGWYGGAVGWIGAEGDGELAVSLRAALLENNRAHVWAGAGIVEGSDSQRELDETERKMRSILPFLERGNDECAA